MKPIVTPEEAVKEIKDGSSIMIGGFGGSGDMPTNLILALSNTRAKNLTIISNTGGLPGFGLLENQRAPINHDILIKNKQVSKIISSFPVSPSPSMKNALEEIYKEENILIELIPQGTLAEKIRAGGAGIRAFYTPTGVNSFPSENKETRLFNNKKYQRFTNELPINHFELQESLENFLADLPITNKENLKTIKKKMILR